jgi:hypothetical protein
VVQQPGIAKNTTRGKEMSMTDDRRERQRRLRWEEKEVDAAAYAAAAVGGRAGDEDVDPAERPLREAGEGEAEGFELAEADLVEAAETGVAYVDPVQAAFPAEAEGGSRATYGEPDHEFSSELPDDDR